MMSATNEFWIRLDNLVAANEIVIDRPKGTAHPKNSEIIYPLDYGYLKGTSAADGNEIDVWQGSTADKRLVAIICTVDTQKGDAEMKLLIGCTGDEMDLVNDFHNNDYMSGIIVKRDDEFS